MNTKMLKDPMLYLASITSSFLFGFIESYFGIFEFHITEYEVTVIVAMSIIGIFASLVIYASFSDAEQKIYKSIRADTRSRMKREGWRPPVRRRQSCLAGRKHPGKRRRSLKVHSG